MQWINKVNHVKVLLVVTAVLLSMGSLVISHFLVRDLKAEEKRKVELWADAMQQFNDADENTDLSLVLSVLNSNNTIPVLVLDSQGQVIDTRNIKYDTQDHAEWEARMSEKARQMKSAGRVIKVYYSATEYIEVCYADSLLLRRLTWWPYVQLGVVLIFVLVAIYALLTSKKAEQNKVWVGLSKETAHQLGTPISSLMAWQEMLRETYPQDELLPEMGKDVERLQMIAERFSKIGSKPEPKPESLNEVLESAVKYIERRTSHRVNIQLELPPQPLVASLSAPLFEWVIENLCKNAIDAMEGGGKITVTARRESQCIAVEVKDTGKGIPKGHFKDVFAPGYTTKKRGWGLGLSLAKRIIEEYHHGRIFVKNSEPGKGTTFRLELKKH